MGRILIHADESCLGNGRAGATPGAAGGLVTVGRDAARRHRDYWVSEPDTTNNRMALRSAIVGLQLAGGAGRTVHFVSDSRYLVQGMTEWARGWVRSRWQRPDGPVPNRELWQELLALASRQPVFWEWVRGHAGHPQNEYANHLATRAARTQTQSGGLVESAYAQSSWASSIPATWPDPQGPGNTVRT